MAGKPDNYGLKLSRPKAIMTWVWLAGNMIGGFLLLAAPVIAGVGTIKGALVMILIIIVIQELSTGALKRWIYGRNHSRNDTE